MKYLLTLFILCCCCASAKAWTFTNIFLGATPMDGTGDNLRLSFGKINTNFYAVTNITGTVSNMVVAASNSVVVLSNIYSARIVAGAGVTATDGTCTNSFVSSFISTPRVTATQFGAALSQTNAIASITVSNFVYNANKAAVSNQWTAIGPVP